jgi:hypothetical protein
MTRGRLWLTVVSFNLGRKYPPGQFRHDVLNIMEHADGREHVVLLPQEIDEEPDPANEHRQLARELEPGSRKVHWRTREPIILSPSFKVVARRRVKVMGSGLEIGGPRGTGPARHLSMCVAEYEGIRLGFGNWHPHRSGLHPRVDEARDVGAGIASDALTRLRAHCGGVSGAYGTDYNSRQMPRMVPGEKVAEHQGLDHLRYWEHPNGAHMELKAHGTLEGTIDPHDPLWARFLVTARS